MIINLIFEEYPDVYHPNVMVMLMFPEIYRITPKQETYLKATAKFVTTRHVAEAFKFAVRTCEDSIGHSFSDSERYRFVSSLWRRFSRLVKMSYVRVEDPSAMDDMLTRWLCYELSLR